MTDPLDSVKRKASDPREHPLPRKQHDDPARPGLQILRTDIGIDHQVICTLFVYVRALGYPSWIRSHLEFGLFL